MTRQFIPARCVEPHPRVAIVGLGFVHLSQPESEERLGPVLPTSPPSRLDGLRQLQTQRQALLVEATRLRNLRRLKAASICEASLRAVTLEILKHGSVQ